MDFSSCIQGYSTVHTEHCVVLYFCCLNRGYSSVHILCNISIPPGLMTKTDFMRLARFVMFGHSNSSFQNDMSAKKQNKHPSYGPRFSELIRPYLGAVREGDRVCEQHHLFCWSSTEIDRWATLRCCR